MSGAEPPAARVGRKRGKAPPDQNREAFELALRGSVLKDMPEIIIANAKRCLRACKPQDRALIEDTIRDFKASVDWLKKHGHLVPGSHPKTISILGAIKAAHEIGVIGPFAAGRAYANEALADTRNVNAARAKNRRARLRAAIQAADSRPKQGQLYAEKLRPTLLKHLARSPDDPKDWPSVSSIRDELERMRNKAG